MGAWGQSGNRPLTRTMLPLIERVRAACEGHVAALPVPYRTHPEQPSFQSLRDPGYASSSLTRSKTASPNRKISENASALRALGVRKP